VWVRGIGKEGETFKLGKKKGVEAEKTKGVNVGKTTWPPTTNPRKGK